MNTPLNPLADYLATAAYWWVNNPGKGFLALTLLMLVVIAVAMALTVLDDCRRDDQLLDRLGSATPGDPTSDLDAVLLAARTAAEATPIPDLVDTDTAHTVITGGVL